VRRARNWVAAPPKSVQGSRDRATDVETLSGATHIAIVLPTAVALHLIEGIESAAFDKTRTEAKGH
jgi:hypothetical protein